MLMPDIKYVTDHKCPCSGKLHKVAVGGHVPGDLAPKIGAVVEYDCPDCKKTHQFKPKVWGGPDTPFPAKHYLSGRIIK
jgi:ssDNA-binding Zn-finger/Zn-ribbon topoisomerase 1